MSYQTVAQARLRKVAADNPGKAYRVNDWQHAAAIMLNMFAQNEAVYEALSESEKKVVDSLVALAPTEIMIGALYLTNDIKDGGL